MFSYTWWKLILTLVKKSIKITVLNERSRWKVLLETVGHRSVSPRGRRAREKVDGQKQDKGNRLYKKKEKTDTFRTMRKFMVVLGRHPWLVNEKTEMDRTGVEIRIGKFCLKKRNEVIRSHYRIQIGTWLLKTLMILVFGKTNGVEITNWIKNVYHRRVPNKRLMQG